MRESVPTHFNVEFLNLSPINPLVSRCEIKVLYAGKNRNRSYITKEVANNMANSLHGTPIVGTYLYETGDFGDHGEEDLVIDENGVRFVKETVPYGYVDSTAKVWWKSYLDEDGVEREYLVTQGFLWTGRYPECKKIIESGRGQSMELHRKTLNGKWSKVDNEGDEYFIINEAMFEALCILGEDVSPCFEGASIKRESSLVYTLDKEEFRDKMGEFMSDLKEALINFNLEGGTGMSKVIEENGVIDDFAKKKKEEEDAKKAAGEETKPEDKKEESKPEDKKEEENPSNPKEKEEEEKKKKKDKFSEEEEFAKKKDKDDDNDSDDNDDDNKDDNDDDDEDDKKKKKGFYSLEEVVEYQELLVKFNSLEEQYNKINSELNSIKPEFNQLKSQQIELENNAKDEMINSFYMLSKEDKADVIENKSNYSLDEIESKLSVICVRNKVNFAMDESSKNEDKIETPITTFNVEDTYDSTPGWLKAVDRVAKNRK